MEHLHQDFDSRSAGFDFYTLNKRVPLLAGWVKVGWDEGCLVDVNR